MCWSFANVFVIVRTACLLQLLAHQKQQAAAAAASIPIQQRLASQLTWSMPSATQPSASVHLQKVSPPVSQVNTIVIFGVELFLPLKCKRE